VATVAHTVLVVAVDKAVNVVVVELVMDVLADLEEPEQMAQSLFRIQVLMLMQ
jgi:hypothetical protein